MKLASYNLAKEDLKKFMNHVIHSFNSADIRIFLYQEIQIQITFRYITFFEFLKIVLIKMVTILMMSEIVTLSILEIQIF